MADVNTGTNAILRVTASLAGGSDAGNYSDVSWALSLVEKSAGTFGFNAGSPPVPASVTVNGGGVFSGGFGFDFRPAGVQSVLIASGTTRIFHNADGSSPGCTVAGSMGVTGTSTAGGPASVSQGVTLPTRKVVPGVPSGVTAVRVSDTQITVSWSQSSASNGQPTSNTIQHRVNGGAWADVATIATATTATVAAVANQKIEYRVLASNTAGSSAYSSASAPIYTTPGAPSGVSAVKNASLDIVVSFTSTVAYAEHEHVVEHGTVTGGVTTWDGSPLATVGSGTLTYTHTAPDPSDVHVYRVQSKAGALTSSPVLSNTVQLLVAPNKPALAALPSHRDKSVATVLTWTHNPVDTTPQAAYEAEYSTDGGSSWTSTGKTTSTVSSKSYTGSTWSANQSVLFRVRTWGEASTGGSDGAGASPWSDTRSTTFKTAPVATIITPADSSTLDGSTVVVQLGFSQAEAASFVDATIQLFEDATLLETLPTLSLAGTTLTTRAENGGEYTVTVVVRDSNGLFSAPVSSTFDVDYLSPVTPLVNTVYLPESGMVQVEITIPIPFGGEAEVEAVTVTRTINGATEPIVVEYPAAPELTFLDTTPTIHGDNEYRVVTISPDGAEAETVSTCTTSEGLWCFLSKGPSFTDRVRFGENLTLKAAPRVDAGLVKAAGRSRPIGLYGRTGDLVVSGECAVTEESSSPEDIETLLLTPGRACYRDPSGRRVFGMVEGVVSMRHSMLGSLSYTVTETS